MRNFFWIGLLVGSFVLLGIDCGGSGPENNRIHIINGDNITGIIVKIAVDGGAPSNPFELEVADLCCTGPNFLIEADIGALITIEADRGGATASKTCEVTSDAIPGPEDPGSNLQTFVNIFFQDSVLTIVCDSGLTDA